MSYEQDLYSKTEIVADGKVEILIDEFITRKDGRETPDRDDGPCEYTITVKRDTTTIHEFNVIADEIELIRL